LQGLARGVELVLEARHRDVEDRVVEPEMRRASERTASVFQRRSYAFGAIGMTSPPAGWVSM
jgi:hypothetical protein